MTDPFTPRPAPSDPWGHEVGEDANHLLDAWGHVPHQAEPLAHLIGAPQPVRARRTVDTKVAAGVLVVALAAAGAVAAVALDLI